MLNALIRTIYVPRITKCLTYVYNEFNVYALGRRLVIVNTVPNIGAFMKVSPFNLVNIVILILRWLPIGYAYSRVNGPMVARYAYDKYWA